MAFVYNEVTKVMEYNKQARREKMRFNYLAPESIEEAVSLLGRYDGKARVIAGGTDLMVQIKDRVIKPEYVVDIENIPGLDYVEYDEGSGLRIGALTSIRALEKSAELRQRYPVITQAAGRLGTVAIRNVATVGGNLCNAMPSAEMSQALVALSAKVKVVGPEGERVVNLEDFFTGVGTTVLKKGEVLVEIQVPVLQSGTYGMYMRHSIRESLDLAIINVAVVITLEPGDGKCKGVKIVVGAVAPTPMRARKAEYVLRGKKIDEALIVEAARVASEEAHPREGSVRGSAEYKKEMVKVYTGRAIRGAIGN